MKNAAANRNLTPDELAQQAREGEAAVRRMPADARAAIDAMAPKISAALQSLELAGFGEHDARAIVQRVLACHLDWHRADDPDAFVRERLATGPDFVRTSLLPMMVELDRLRREGNALVVSLEPMVSDAPSIAQRAAVVRAERELVRLERDERLLQRILPCAVQTMNMKARREALRRSSSSAAERLRSGGRERRTASKSATAAPATDSDEPPGEPPPSEPPGDRGAALGALLDGQVPDRRWFAWLAAITPAEGALGVVALLRAVACEWTVLACIRRNHGLRTWRDVCGCPLCRLGTPREVSVPLSSGSDVGSEIAKGARQGAFARSSLETRNSTGHPREELSVSLLEATPRRQFCTEEHWTDVRWGAPREGYRVHVIGRNGRPFCSAPGDLLVVSALYRPGRVTRHLCPECLGDRTARKAWYATWRPL